jgi:hypothetical protein
VGLLSKVIGLFSQMPNADPAFADGICTISTNSDWLNANGELPVCLAQPSLVDPAAIPNDAARPDSLSLAEAIFADEEGQSRLSRWFAAQRGLLVFPEYAFSSGDFGALNTLISQHPQPLIAIGGFGAVEGGVLRELLGQCRATWEEGAAAIDPQNRYNAGWCWIHHGVGDSSCYVFIKNFLEQHFEIAVDGLTTGNYILRVEGQDLVLFPIICSDLICEQPNSARVRLARSLAARPPNGPNVLVAAPLYTDRPQSDHWSGVINNIVSLNARRAGLIFVNQLAAPMLLEPEQDQWRNLSGGFVHKHIMPGAPRHQFQAVRYVSTDEGSGLILRQSWPGVAFGHFRWVNAVELGRIWAPQHRVLEPGGFRRLTESIASQELRRYVSRRQALISNEYHASVEPLIRTGLDQIRLHENESHLAPRLWPKLLSGVEESTSGFDPDKIDTQTANLDRALAVYAAVEQSSGAAPLVSDSGHGQLRLEEREVLVWKSPLHDWRKMWQVLRALSVNHPHEPQLLVVGSGRGGHSIAGPIEPDKSVDYTVIPQGRDFTGARHRHIFWRPLGDIENSMIDPDTTLAQKRTTIVNQLVAN